MAFIDKISRAMKLDEVAVEGGFDINSDAILLRAEQLSKSEVRYNIIFGSWDYVALVYPFVFLG